MYEKMKKELLSFLRDSLGDSFKIEVSDVSKNGIQKNAFILTNKDMEITPMFYFEDYLNDYSSGRSIESIAKQIFFNLLYCKEHIFYSSSNLCNFQNHKGKIAYRIINTKRNETLLESIPHFSFFDLSIAFQIILEMNEENSATCLITNDILKAWGITKETLNECVLSNFSTLLPTHILTMNQIPYNETALEGNISDIIERLSSDFMYIVSNRYKTWGFANILYPNFLSTFANRFGSFFILPGSVHEAILVPNTSQEEYKHFQQMVTDINLKEVDQEDFLSDSVYFYNAETGKITAHTND